MESFVANSTPTKVLNPTSIYEVNEVLPACYAKISTSLLSPQIQRIQHHLTVPNGSNFSGKQSFSSQKDSKQSQGNQSRSKKSLVPSILSQIKMRRWIIDQPSITDKRLKQVIQNLQDHPIEEELFDEEQSPINAGGKYIARSRRFLRRLMKQPRFHYIIITLIIIDLIIVFIELTIGKSMCFEPVLILLF